MAKLFIKTGIGLAVFFVVWILAYNQAKFTTPLWVLLLIFFAGIITIVIAFAISYKQILRAEAQQRWNQRQ